MRANCAFDGTVVTVQPVFEFYIEIASDEALCIDVTLFGAVCSGMWLAMSSVEGGVNVFVLCHE